MTLTSRTRRTASRTVTARLAIALLAASLLSTACGARLTEDQLQQALGSGQGGVRSGTGVLGPGGELSTDDPALSGGELVPGVDPGAPGGDPAGGGDPSAPGGVAGPAADGTGAGQQAPGAAPGSADTRAAPPGGNGGATDTGVTETEITVSNVSDVSGPVPGIFEDAQLATKAFFAMFARTEGTIFGRQIKLLPLDSRLDAGANRTAYIQACDQSLAAVGSISAFDQGAAPVVQDCGIPDIRGLSTTNQMKAVPNAYPVNTAGRPGDRGLAQYTWPSEAFPEAVKKAAFIFIEGEVTRQLAEEDIKATTENLGYNWVYKQGIAISETSYTSFVLNMKDLGVRYVTLVGAYQQAANLAKEMQKQGFTPDVYEPTTTAYTSDYLKLAGPAAEGSIVGVTGSLLSEIEGNAELQAYTTWLGQVAPGKSPTLLGQYSWGAARLFTELAKKAGPQLTRAKLLAEVAKVNAFDSNGMLPKLDVGGKKIQDCIIFVQVKGGQFTRAHPAQGRRCGDGVVNVS